MTVPYYLPHPRTFREKLVSGLIVSGVILSSAGVGYYVGHAPVDKAGKPINMPVMMEQLARIDENIVQLAAQRCMTVQTPVMNIDVYNMPALGVKPVGKPKIGNRPPPKVPVPLPEAKAVAKINVATQVDLPAAEGAGGN